MGLAANTPPLMVDEGLPFFYNAPNYYLQLIKVPYYGFNSYRWQRG